MNSHVAFNWRERHDRKHRNCARRGRAFAPQDRNWNSARGNVKRQATWHRRIFIFAHSRNLPNTDGYEINFILPKKKAGSDNIFILLLPLVILMLSGLMLMYYIVKYVGSPLGVSCNQRTYDKWATLCRKLPNSR